MLQVSLCQEMTTTTTKKKKLIQNVSKRGMSEFPRFWYSWYKTWYRTETAKSTYKIACD